MTFRTAQKALASFKEFVNAAQSRVVRGLFAFSPVSPPVAALFLAPPWPNRTFYTIIGGISEFLIYLLCFQFFLKRKTGVERLEKWLTRSVYAAVGSFALYLILWNCFFYQLPNYWNMDIGGFVYNEGTITILSNPEGQDKTTTQLIREATNNVEEVFEIWSVVVTRIVVVLVWATFFASIILAFTTFIALRYKEQEKIEKDKKEQKELEKQKKAQAKQESQSKPEQT